MLEVDSILIWIGDSLSRRMNLFQVPTTKKDTGLQMWNRNHEGKPLRGGGRRQSTSSHLHWGDETPLKVILMDWGGVLKVVYACKGKRTARKTYRGDLNAGPQCMHVPHTKVSCPDWENKELKSCPSTHHAPMCLKGTPPYCLSDQRKHMVNWGTFFS